MGNNFWTGSKHTLRLVVSDREDRTVHRQQVIYQAKSSK